MSLCGKDLGRQFPGWADEGGIETCSYEFNGGPHDALHTCAPVLDEDRIAEDQRPLIVGLLKVRNELVRDGNLYRCLNNLMEFCDTIVACDDASTDGTDLVLREFFVEHQIPLTQLLIIKPEEQDFRKELAVKQRMLERIHRLRPHWIWWHDGDEVLPHPSGVRTWINEMTDGDPKRPVVGGYRFPYVQLWREGWWARTDSGFADGKFIKLWHWHPKLALDYTVDRTHHMQFPVNLGSIEDVPTPVIHFGNWGKNLQFKCTQYWGGLGGVDRHMNFEQGQFQLLDEDWSAYPRVVRGPRQPVNYPEARLTTPQPFTEREKTIIRELRNLKGLPEWFTVVIPTHNRANFLSEAIASLKRQRYQKWIALVLDDGSTDRTPELMHRIALHDPRVFYARHRKRGAVAMNEIGMRFACEATEWWTRLGSDDYFEPDKLYLDALALKRAEWCYGPFRVLRHEASPALASALADQRVWKLAELCNVPQPTRQIVDGLLGGQFHVSWANIAVRTELLRQVRLLHGNFCPPELVNMEDFVLNARLARLAPPLFRGKLPDDDPPSSVADMVRFGDTDDAIADAVAHQSQFLHDAIWRVNPIGASASTETTSNDDALSREIIKKENDAC